MRAKFISPKNFAERLCYRIHGRTGLALRGFFVFGLKPADFAILSFIALSIYVFMLLFGMQSLFYFDRNFFLFSAWLALSFEILIFILCRGFELLKLIKNFFTKKIFVTEGMPDYGFLKKKLLEDIEIPEKAYVLMLRKIYNFSKPSSGSSPYMPEGRLEFYPNNISIFEETALVLKTAGLLEETDHYSYYYCEFNSDVILSNYSSYNAIEAFILYLRYLDHESLVELDKQFFKVEGEHLEVFKILKKQKIVNEKDGVFNWTNILPLNMKGVFEWWNILF